VISTHTPPTCRNGKPHGQTTVVDPTATTEWFNFNFKCYPRGKTLAEKEREKEKERVIINSTIIFVQSFKRKRV
jgi:hypothetical protein